MILCEKEEIRITVLGGIGLYHLDRLRVTLKIEIPNRQYPEYLEHPEIANLALRQSVDIGGESRWYHDAIIAVHKPYFNLIKACLSAVVC